MSTVLLEAKNLVKYFLIRSTMFSRVKNWVRAVDDISFDIKKGEVLGLVGESGCGKTTTARCILRLIETTSGEVLFKGRDILRIDKDEMKEVRKNMGIVFQNPLSSLNPRMLVKDIVSEPLIVNKVAKSEKINAMAEELLDTVGLKPEHMWRYPHEFSGGQKQRIAIARALALNPEFMVFDEPTSALDVSVQARILNLLKELQQKTDLTYLFVSHNLDVVRYVSDVICVMYAGKLVERGPVEDVYTSPLHPYTEALFVAIPVPDPEAKSKAVLGGEAPSLINPPSGCRFHPRCKYAMPTCQKAKPKPTLITRDHLVSCHLYGD